VSLTIKKLFPAWTADGEERKKRPRNLDIISILRPKKGKGAQSINNQLYLFTFKFLAPSIK